MKIIEGNKNYLAILTEMNIHLRQDEEIDNVMTYDQVESRMKDFIEGNIYKTYLLKENSIIYGYALINITKNPIYLRQLFIKREYRRNGLGKLLMSKIIKELKIKELDVEVFTWNRKAIEFYKGSSKKVRL